MYHADYASMRTLGKQYGLTSHEFGRLLVKAGLRTDDNEPSEAALKYGFVKYVPNGRNHKTYPIWHRDWTIRTLIKKGLLQPPQQGGKSVSQPGEKSLDG